MKRFFVIEDNGGGLTLVVFGNDGNVEYLHSGYEYGTTGRLVCDLKALKQSGSTEDWDGNAEDPQAEYDDMTSYPCGWEVVADNYGIYPDVMGRAAAAEFGVVID